jgi:hypothetical protein
MTREEFISILDRKKYSYKIEGDRIVVTYEGSVLLDSISLSFSGFSTSLPSGVEFRNGNHVDLGSITSLPPGVVFRNVGGVYLRSLTNGRINKWKGNIEGIDPKRLLNKMIKDGLFER